MVMAATTMAMTTVTTMAMMMTMCRRLHDAAVP
jgi:hypothetical protein